MRLAFYFGVLLVGAVFAGVSRADDDFIKWQKKLLEHRKESAEKALELQIKLAKLRREYLKEYLEADDPAEAYEVSLEYRKKVLELQLKTHKEAAERAFEFQRKMLKLRKKNRFWRR